MRILRIIGGKNKGQKIKTLSGTNSRPTLDKVRGSVFNALYDVSDARVLDLFGGSGALALEALSRGAAKCVIVDHCRAAIDIIAANAEKLGYSSQVDLRCKDFKQAVSRGESFDLIFLDPPYGKGFLAPSYQLIADKRLLAAKGIIVAETGADAPEYAADSRLTLIKEKKYGTVKILYYRFNEE